MLVTDFPEWNECPFRLAVPEHVKIFRGDATDVGYTKDLLVVLVCDKSRVRHVELEMTWPEEMNWDIPQITDRILTPVLHQLGLKPMSITTV